MRKFKKIDWFYAIVAYFIIFGLVGIIFNSVSIVMPWSISIFIILYLAYWISIYIKDMKYVLLARMELLKEQMEENIKK